MPRAGRIRWNVSAFEQIRRLPTVEDRLQAEVSKVLSQVGDGYEGGVEAGRTRSRGYVVTASEDARRDNSENQSLLRSLGGGA